jgi:hypothetical protein
MPVIGPDKLVNIDPTVLDQVVPDRVPNKLVHNMEFAGKTQQVD